MNSHPDQAWLDALSDVRIDEHQKRHLNGRMYNSNSLLVDIHDQTQDDKDTRVLLLQRECTAYRFDLRASDRPPEVVKFLPGTLAKPISELEKKSIVRFLDEHGRKISDGLHVIDLLDNNVFCTVSRGWTTRILDSQALILLAVPCQRRCPLFADLERFNWIENLRAGDEVAVELLEDSGRFASATVLRVGERGRHVGSWFTLNVEASENLLDISSNGNCVVAGHQLYNISVLPKKRTPMVRNVPIVLDSKNYAVPVHPSERIATIEGTLFEPATSSYSINDDHLTRGFNVGDACIWRNSGKAHKGIVRFIGRLKKHTNVYAGVQFEEAVGEGTGVFEGETLFTTPPNHAGFILLNAIEPLVERELPPKVPPPPDLQPKDFLIEAVSAGDVVDVCHYGIVRSGVVEWIGDWLSEDRNMLQRSAFVRLFAEAPLEWRTAWKAPMDSMTLDKSCVIVPVDALRRCRAHEVTNNSTPIVKTDFGSLDSGVERTKCLPWKFDTDLIGRMKGIQGHRNSCYLDATLYSMFAHSTAFDFLLERPATSKDVPEYSEFIRLLSTEVVYPLRKFHYVRADHVMKVREMLSKALPSVSGLTSEEKDPEEILSHLFQRIFKAEPFIRQRNMKDGKTDSAYLCPLVVDNWPSGVATTQHLLERSMKSANVCFYEPPRLLILQLPRYGQQKVFDNILPLEKMDITSLVHDVMQTCFTCKYPAVGMCPECFLCKKVFISEVSFCVECFSRHHISIGQADHVMRDFYPSVRHQPTMGNITLTLRAVLCIETSHYVSFVRTARGRWLFFDSMADREGCADGFNVPIVRDCGDTTSWWLSSAGWNKLRSADDDGTTKALLAKKGEVDELIVRLLSDSYICFYELDDVPRSSSSSTLLDSVIQRVKHF